MGAAFTKNTETFKVIDNYLKVALAYRLKKLYYVSTHSSNGLTPIVHYDIEYTFYKSSDLKQRKARITVYFNNASNPPTITRMEVM